MSLVRANRSKKIKTSVALSLAYSLPRKKRKADEAEAFIDPLPIAATFIAIRRIVRKLFRR